VFFENRYGSNIFAVRRMKSLLKIVLDNFDDPIFKILLAAAGISIIIGLFREGLPGIIDGLSILFALFIITVVNSANNYDSERKLRDLTALTEEQSVGVFRNST
jgi:magnesium-transporting ATPase (P-type)